MGWTCALKPKGQSLVRFFKSVGALTWNSPHVRQRVLDTALINKNEFYAAVESVNSQTQDKRVFALVILIKRFKNESYNICWEEMDEDMGPCYYNCPERILDLLTPTSNQNALEWRRKCREKLDKRGQMPPLKKGTAIKFSSPVKFGYGISVDQLVVSSTRGSRIYCTNEHGYGKYRISRQWLNQRVADGGVKFA